MALDIDEAKRWAVSAFDAKDNTTYHKYERYMAGDQPLHFAVDMFREAFGNKFGTFCYNVCETIVDAHADRMKITGFGSDDDDELKKRRAAGETITDATVTKAQLAQDVWDANGMDHREGQVEADQFGLGDGYVIVDFLDNEPVIWPVRPTQMRVRYSEDRPGHRVAAARLWGEGKLWRLNVWTEAQLVKFQAPRTENSKDAPKKPDAFVPWEGGGGNEFTHPVPGIVPVFHFANNARVNDYGVSELRNVLPLQDKLNLSMATLTVVEQIRGIGQAILLGADLDQESSGTAEAVERFVVGASRLLSVAGGTDGERPTLAEMSAADLSQFTNVIDKVESKIASITKVPRNYFEQRAAEAISGESKRMDESPFIAKITDRQNADGPIWAEMMAYILTAMGVPTTAGEIRVNWQPAAPTSKEEELQAGVVKKGLGFPFEVVLREMGYEPDQIADIMAKKAEEDAAAVDRQRQMFDAGTLNGQVAE